MKGRPKKLLVLVNPKGGTGQAVKKYSDIVEPMFLSAGIEVTKQGQIPNSTHFFFFLI